MLAAVTTGKRTIDLLDRAEPAPPGPGQVTVRPQAVGLCGSDFHLFEGQLDVVGYPELPRVQGHEVAAVIDRLGPDAPQHLHEGQSVSLFPLLACGECYPCRVGRPNVCDRFQLIGVHVDGGLQEQLVIAADRVYPITSSRPAVSALAEPFSIAVRAVNRGRIASQERIVVMGAGPIGQAVALAAAERGAHVLAIDPFADRLEISKALGAEVLPWTTAAEVAEYAREWAGGEGAPAVVDATGNPDAISAGVDIVASAGRVVIVGMSGRDLAVQVSRFVEKELDVLGVSVCQPHEFAEAVSIVQRHPETLGRLVSHEFPLRSAPEALTFAMENPKEVMKVVIGSV
ncbi:MAG: zinc-binding dehydrogenase [Solirubrobacterales bacterium]|jgi:L-gulonate 5-dehydrogenase|nr:zinc-binding dehydrogenase [Solirubrobacterales bacterium]